MGSMEKRGKHMADVTPDEQGLFVMPELDDTNDLSAAKEVVLPDVPKYLMPSKAYDVLKWVGLVLCPATATLIGAVGPAWGMPNVDATVLTVNSVGLFIGMCIGASHVSAMGR